jgi:hypothetical protein
MDAHVNSMHRTVKWRKYQHVTKPHLQSTAVMQSRTTAVSGPCIARQVLGKERGARQTASKSAKDGHDAGLLNLWGHDEICY